MWSAGWVLRGAVLACALSAGAVAAQQADFDVTLAGVPVATLSVDASLSDGRYAVRVMIRSDGLAGIVTRIRFDSRSGGRVGRSGFVPAFYTEQADTGRRQSQVEMVYDAGVPRVVTYASPRPDGPDLLDPATQGGALDPATALFAGLRDVAVGQGCDAQFAVFDGRRRAEYVLSGTGAETGAGTTCTGTYRRVAGYTAQEMAERTRFALELVYAPEGDALRVVEASVQTIYGKVRLKRR